MRGAAILLCSLSSSSWYVIGAPPAVPILLSSYPPMRHMLRRRVSAFERDGRKEGGAPTMVALVNGLGGAAGVGAAPRRGS